MKAIELAKAFDPRTFEDPIYKRWQESGAFEPGPGRGIHRDEAPYVVVIPPPNVTGILHLGHGLVVSIIDIVIRYHRMRGEPALWVPGTDHAGIATQHVVEKRLRDRGISRHELGRERFLRETWLVKEEHHRVISRQLARMGASVDWGRERFTMDEGLSRAVREVFVSLFERDLLYKGNYLVNWCPHCGTALADDEVEHEDTPGKMYHIRYPLRDSPPGAGAGGGFVEIATTRPETLLGDTAVAVHPEDPRYGALVGRQVELPLTGRSIPVVADAYVDREFGTGVVKITPAHDPNDWELAKRHDLPVINILCADGRLNDAVPEKYRGMDVQAAREAVIEDLKAAGLYIREENITHAVGHCYRCHTVIEPFLSEQWFVRMKPLAEKALAAWRRGELIFYPSKWENTYEHWLENIRDWCISRQLWWGHRIPAWTCKDCGRLAVSRSDISECPHCHSRNIEQDPDVLDTWFSSWLWPFSVMGWENGGCDTADFKTFFPTTALVTGYDIIFFWVARMIMASLEFTGRVPFRDIYIHGLIRDSQGRKMSKSLGNGLDPLELVDEYGADALKFTMAFLCAQGQDILMDKDSFKLGSKFANKIWNASRYILMNLEGRNLVPNPALLPVDTWIRSRLNGAARAMADAFLGYRFNDAAAAAYGYFWNDFCDWYVEATKLSLKGGDDAEKDRAATVLLDVLAESLRLLHPLLPFITEEIYGKLPNIPAGELLITAAYPEYDEGRTNQAVEGEFELLKDLITQVRTLRSECTIPPDKKLRLLLRPAEDCRETLESHAELVKMLAGSGELEITAGGGAGTDKVERPAGSIALVGRSRNSRSGTGFEAFVYVAAAADLGVLKAKFGRNIEKDRAFITALRAKLDNGNFLKNAPAELVAQERTKLEDAVRRTEKLESYIRDLG
ncbi:MAG: valine--tRNA ligase [Treponema sp.]|jgi:valyl-tRNA synthetase|nr:valine--tRNA ligase [Treponema sp.]